MNMVIKVADFGLAVNTGDKQYYRLSSNDVDIKLPVMWMAPESLSTCVFSEKSDVVSIVMCIDQEWIREGREQVSTPVCILCLVLQLGKVLLQPL